jgi:hypothetical protein
MKNKMNDIINTYIEERRELVDKVNALENNLTELKYQYQLKEQFILDNKELWEEYKNKDKNNDYE